MAFLMGFINRQFIYTPPVPTASFEGKTVIVTGGNVGLGKEACRWMIKLGASQVIITCRNIEKGEAAANDIRTSTGCSPDTIQVWQLDLGSYASVIAFANRVKAELPRLDVLLSNAGLGTRTFRMSEDNEESITTNVISLFLHAFLILPKLRETAVKYNTQSHFTITSSELYEVAKFTERTAPAGQLFATLSDEKKARMSDRYNVTKLLEVFVVKQLAIRYPLESGKVIVNCVAPGLCNTSLHREYDSALVRVLLKAVARPAEVGARTLVHGASAGAESHGQYVPDCKITPTGGLTRGKEGAELQQRVWMELADKLEGISTGVTSLV